jgi:hypothetical protein
MSKDEYAVEVLLNEEVVTEDQVEQARQLATKKCISLVKALRELTFIDADTVAKTIASYLGYDYVDLASLEISPDVLKTVPHSEARRCKVIPVAVQGSTIVVATSDPTNLDMFDDLRNLLKANVEPVVADEDQLTRAIDHNYGIEGDPGTRTSAGARGDDTGVYRHLYGCATDRQLSYLDRLKYEGPAPTTKREASLLIDAIKTKTAAAKESQKPFTGLTPQQVKQTQVKAHREWLKERRKEVREQIREDLADQREFERDLRQSGGMDRGDALAGWLLRIGSHCMESRHLDGLLVTTEDAKNDPGMLPPYDTCREETCECEIEPVCAREVPKGTRIAERGG